MKFSEIVEKFQNLKENEGKVIFAICGAFMVAIGKDAIFLNKVEMNKRLYYLNLIDAELNVQRTMIRIMYKNRWIDEKKYKVSMEMLYEIGKILGGLIKAYAKNYKK